MVQMGTVGTVNKARGLRQRLVGVRTNPWRKLSEMRIGEFRCEEK
jgi:hypothetical protein